jgi:hypothetical protein
MVLFNHRRYSFGQRSFLVVSNMTAKPKQPYAKKWPILSIAFISIFGTECTGIMLTISMIMPRNIENL